MQSYFEIEQGTKEWFNIKKCKIGGTRAKSISENYSDLVLELLVEGIEPEFKKTSYISDAMINGIEQEGAVRDRVSALYNIVFIDCGWIGEGIAGISPDGITEELDVAIEIKNPEPKNHIKYLLENILPVEYVPQCVHYFTVNEKLTELYFVSARIGHKDFIKRITLDTVVKTVKGAYINTVKKVKQYEPDKTFTIRDIVKINRELITEIEKDFNNKINRLTF